MRDFIAIVCFVLLMIVFGLAERFYLKWKIYVACSEVNLMVAEGRIEDTLQFIKSRSDVLHATSVNEAINVCQEEKL